MEYKSITKQELFDILEIWDKYIPGKVHLIACGGTALTLQDIKDSTKDVDFIVPEENEYVNLIRTIKKLGYKETTGHGWARDDGFLFDLFKGKYVHTTELLESPLDQGNNIPVKEFKKFYVGVLNDYDLIISKIFRGTSTDYDDCLSLIRSKGKKIDIETLKNRYKETADYDNNPERMMHNLDSLLMRIPKE